MPNLGFHPRQWQFVRFSRTSGQVGPVQISFICEPKTIIFVSTAAVLSFVSFVTLPDDKHHFPLLQMAGGRQNTYVDALKHVQQSPSVLIDSEPYMFASLLLETITDTISHCSIIKSTLASIPMFLLKVTLNMTFSLQIQGSSFG